MMWSVALSRSIGLWATFLFALTLVPSSCSVAGKGLAWLWASERRTPWHEDARHAQRLSSGALPSEGAFVLAQGTARAPLVADPWLHGPEGVALLRVVEMYAWHETLETTTKRRWGGGREIRETLAYARAWTPEPPRSEGFREPDGHVNPPLPFPTIQALPSTLEVGGHRVDATQMPILFWQPVALADLERSGPIEAGRTVDDFTLYLGEGGPDEPAVGDIRVRWYVVPDATEIALLGTWRHDAVHAIDREGWPALIVAWPGDAAALAQVLESADQLARWALRVGCVVALYLALFLLLGPLFVLLDIVPPVGWLARVIVALAATPVVFLVTFVTVEAARWSLHPWIVALGMLVVALAALGWWSAGRAIRREREQR